MEGLKHYQGNSPVKMEDNFLPQELLVGYLNTNIYTMAIWQLGKLFQNCLKVLLNTKHGGKNCIFLFIERNFLPQRRPHRHLLLLVKTKTGAVKEIYYFQEPAWRVTLRRDLGASKEPARREN